MIKVILNNYYNTSLNANKGSSPLVEDVQHERVFREVMVNLFVILVDVVMKLMLI